MVPSRLRRLAGRCIVAGRRRAPLSLTLPLTLLVLAGCGNGASSDAAVGADAEDAAALLVRSRYTAADAAATGAWAWTSPTGEVYVLADVQSTEEGVVQGRVDLWAVSGPQAQIVGRSAVMPSAAAFGAFAFEDMTGDGLPDLFGFVADSAEVSYPVFIPGASGTMVDELESTAPGWRFSTEQQTAPDLGRGPTGPCALRLWAEEPAPDGQPAGWRYLEILRRGPHQLAAPAAAPPSCGRAGPDSL